MNNMKKALALVMSLALAASTFVVGAAYDDVPETHENRIAINLLGDLGVMVGDAGTNDFRPEGTLKRSEAAAIVYRLRTGKTNADSYVGTTGFSDVSDSHWASGYINYCVNQGIIAGYPDGTFKPDQDVTYAEYIKMVVCALNLQKVETTTYIDMNTGVLVSEDKITTAYPTGYIALASDQQINEGIDYLNPNDKISRAEVAQGAYNAIFESYYKLDPKDADYVKDGTTYQHLAEQVFKLEKTTGVVIAYEDYTAEDGKLSQTGSSQSDNYFEVSFRDKDGNVDTDNFEYADFNPELVGQEVYVWEKQRNTSSATDVKVVAVVATENNTVSTINTNDLKKDGNDLYYTDVNGKKQTLKQSDLADTTLRLNGAAYDAQAAWDILKAVAEKRIPMDLTIIDNDDSTKSPSVISMKVYGETEITSVSDDKLYIKQIKDTYDFNEIPKDTTVDGVTSDDDGRKMYETLLAAINDDNDGDWDVIDLNAGSIDLLNDDDTVNEKVSYYDGIAKEDKVMIYADINGVVDIRKIEEKSGTVSAMSGGKFRVGDEEVYIVAGDGMKNQMTTNNGYDATVYVDPFTGYVVDVDEGVGSVEDYYYLHLLSNTYENSKDFSVTAYDYEGNKVKLTFKDTDAEESFAEALWGDGATLSDYLDANHISNSTGSAVIDAIGILDVNSKGEIVRWRNNSVGQLEPNATYDKDNTYNSSTGYVTIEGTRVEVKPSSIVFGVEYTDKTKEKLEDVKTYVGSFPSITSQTASVDYYLKKDEDDLKAALVRDRTKGGNTEFTNVIGYVVDERFEYTDDDKGYAVYTIASKGESKEYETEVTDRADLRDRSSNSVKGKMIRYDLTTDGKIMYNDATDIDVLDLVSDDVEDSFKAIVQGKTFSNFTRVGICPGNPDIDEDELYFGVVVENKDGKYIRLADENGNNVYIDYADDVKAHVIADSDKDTEKWDKMKGFSVGNIAESNSQYTTYAAVRIADGDDINDARVTEIYAKTIKDGFYQNTIGGEAGLNDPSYVSPDAEGGSLTSEVNNMTGEFGEPSVAKDTMTNQATEVGGGMTVRTNYTLGFKVDPAATTATGTGKTVTINNKQYEIVTGAASTGMTGNQIALLNGSNYVQEVTGAATGVKVVISTAADIDAPATLEVPLVLSTVVDGQTVTKEFTVEVKVENETEDALNMAQAEENLKNFTAPAAVTAVDFAALGVGDTIPGLAGVTDVSDTTGYVFTITDGKNLVEVDGNGNVVKKSGAQVPAADTPITIKVQAQVKDQITKAEDAKEITLTIQTTSAEDKADQEAATAFLNTALKVDVVDKTDPEKVTAADTGFTYGTVLNVKTAASAATYFDVADGAVSNANASTAEAEKAALTALTEAWTALTDNQKALVAESCSNRADAAAITTFLADIATAMDETASSEADAAAVSKFEGTNMADGSTNYKTFLQKATDVSSNATTAFATLDSTSNVATADVADMEKALAKFTSALNSLTDTQRATVYKNAGVTEKQANDLIAKMEEMLTDKEEATALKPVMDKLKGVVETGSKFSGWTDFALKGEDGIAAGKFTQTATAESGDEDFASPVIWDFTSVDEVASVKVEGSVTGATVTTGTEADAKKVTITVSTDDTDFNEEVSVVITLTTGETVTVTLDGAASTQA